MSIFRNRSGNRSGSLDSDGTLRDSNGRMSGTYRGGEIRDRGGILTGRVSSDGTIRDRNGNYAGKVSSDGTIRDSHGNYVGRYED